MTPLKKMMAKELLGIQIEMFQLLREELKLRNRTHAIDLKLGLCSQEWYDKQRIRMDDQRMIYGNLLDDFIASEVECTKDERGEEEFPIASTNYEVLKDELGKDLKAASDENTEVNDEKIKEDIEIHPTMKTIVIPEEKGNVLKPDKKKGNKLGGKPYISPGS